MDSDPASKRAPHDIRLGRYQVIRHLATGGMGAVYLARDPQRGRDVAIKVLSGDTANRPGAVDRFRAEAVHAARLRHENIVSLYDFGEYQGVYFLVLEYVDGTDLHEYISRKQRLDPQEARFITAQAAKALHHAHKQGLVHRDIKPSNLLLARKDGQLLVKLSDFGLARQVDDESFRVTREGTTVGTVDYMSPEQGRDSRAADIRSDIYSLGCTLFHMLAGQAPFPEGGLTERLYKHMTEEPPDVRDLNPRVPEWLAKVLRRMLAKEPADRYQTPKELLKALVRGESEAPSREDVLRSLADLELAETRKKKSPDTDTPATPPTAPERRVGPTQRPGPARQEPLPNDKAEPPAWLSKGLPSSLLLAAVAAGVIALAILLALLLLAGEGKDNGQQKDPGEKPDTPKTPSESPDQSGGIVPPGATAATWPSLRAGAVVSRHPLKRAFRSNRSPTRQRGLSASLAGASG
ncbi:MAG: serine/threonine protein kinase [Planctomycetes bacterium]|nr:serine/threonine protein kinase [Planctomycetota bacterium]